MRKKLLLILAVTIVVCTSFAGIKLYEPEQTENIYPVTFKWHYTGTKTPSYYALFYGTSEDEMFLYSNNLNTETCKVYHWRVYKNDTVLWKIVAYFGDGTTLESNVESFVLGSEKKQPTVEIPAPKKMKFVLTWDDPNLDLDLHLTGTLPNTENDFHLFRSLSEWEKGSPWFDYVTLDYDRTGLNRGAEVLTLKKAFFDELIHESVIKITVRDYTNKTSTHSTALSMSNARLLVYFDDVLAYEFEVPVNVEGNFWNVILLTLSPYEFIIEQLDKMSYNYSSIWPYNLENGGLKPSPIPKLPTEKPVVYATVKAESIESVIDLLLDLGFNIDPEKVELVKITLPENEKLDEETMSVFISGKPTNLFIREAKKLKTQTDIIFVVDTTVSMSEEISGVKKSLADFIKYLNTIGFDARVGFLPYDDYVPSSYLGLGWQNLSNYSDTLNFINKINSLNGRNEIPYTAIDYAYRNASWTNGSERHIVLVTDEDSESGGAYESISKKSLIRKLPSDFTVHNILSSDGDLSRYSTDYSVSGDQREIAQKTGGVIEYTDSRGNIDLTKSGILNFAENSYYVLYENPNHTPFDDVEFIFYTEKGLGKGSK